MVEHALSEAGAVLQPSDERQDLRRQAGHARVVGGGLAGLSLGIALRRAGVETRIIEAGHYPRHRVCGEFITGLDQTTIEQLGIGPAFAGAGSPGSVTFFLRGRAIGRHALPSPARTISRYTLDARLAALFTAANGQLSTDQRLASPPQEPGWVQTSGRQRTEASPWIGLKLHARYLLTSDELEMHLGDGAYVGLSAVEDGWINVCGLFQRRPGLRFDRAEAMAESPALLTPREGIPVTCWVGADENAYLLAGNQIFQLSDSGGWWRSWVRLPRCSRIPTGSMTSTSRIW